jgi:superfamily II DNA or RNA helicase
LNSIIPPTKDPFFFDREDLKAIASTKNICKGLDYFKEYRVMDLDYDKEMLFSQVEDDNFDFPIGVEIRITSDNRLSFYCSCDGFDHKSACHHIVASLFSYADQLGESGELRSASHTAVKNRIKRGMSEVEVEPASGEPWFGKWRAVSVSSTTHFPRKYQVTVRSLHRRENLCSCPDYSNNQLGTCKHIEAVLHKVRKHQDYEKFKESPAPLSYVYIAWDVEDAPRLCLHKAKNLPLNLQGLITEYFDNAGFFKGRLPDEFFRFVDLVQDREAIHIGEDAIDFAQHLASRAAHQLRSAEITSKIKLSRGKLPGIKARLYSYQIEGMAFLAGKGRVLLADDMGLGKTLQSIAAAVWLKEHGGVKRILIVCPASLKQQWAKEISKFTELESQVIQGPPQKRGVQYRRKVSFHILNYELILRDLSLINDLLQPDLIILDEAQRIKNWRTKISSAVKLIPSRFAFVLSGTPLENRLEDLYSLMQVIDPKILGPLWRYMIDFHITNDRDKVLGYRNLSMLRQRIAPVMLRRDRRLVRDQLPDCILKQLDVGMTDKQIELHDSAMSQAGTLAQITKKRQLTPTEQNRLIAALQQARMACNAAGLVDKETKGSPKLDELDVILDEFCLQAGLKAVVFSQWELMTRMVEERLRKMKLGFVRLHGGVPTAKRGELMDRFREDDSVQVFLSTDAGGVGLNLQSGSVLINMDVPWNPAVLEQRNARVHRLGQTRKVQIITMVAFNSYEEHVLSLVKGKQNLFDNVIAENATEEVVGVSKKLIASLLETLDENSPAKPGNEQTEKNEDDQSGARNAENGLILEQHGKSVELDPAFEKIVSGCIVELQDIFGPRIERILGAGGGLLVVLDLVDSEANRIALHLSEKIPVAIIDLHTLEGLERLGSGSPVSDSQIYYDAEQDMVVSKSSRLAAKAREKIKAARILLDQGVLESALDLLLTAMLTAASDRAGRTVPVTSQDAGVWIYGEALPKGLLSQDDINLLMRGISLTQSSSLPDELLNQLFDDADTFVQG